MVLVCYQHRGSRSKDDYAAQKGLMLGLGLELELTPLCSEKLSYPLILVKQGSKYSRFLLPTKQTSALNLVPKVCWESNTYKNFDSPMAFPESSH